MNDIVDFKSYKQWAIKQKLDELTKKLSRIRQDSVEWTQTKLKIESLKKDSES